jgi:hypothetical protein
MIGQYCVVRTYSAGVYCGVVSELAGKIGVVTEARIIRRWSGALTTLEIATSGIESGSQLSAPAAQVLLTEIIAVIPCTAKAEEILRGIE